MEEIIEILLNAELANRIVQNLAGYVVYIYPGIITIYLYNFFNARKTKNTQAFIIKSFAISYLYNVLLQVVFPKICFLKNRVKKNTATYNLTIIFVAVIGPYLAFRFIHSKVFSYMCGILGISTSVTDIPFELLGDKDEVVTCLKVYLKDEPYVYIGFLKDYEYENEHHQYIILSGYKKYYITSKRHERLIEEHQAEEYKEKVFIKFSDIKRIEKLERDRAEKEIYG